MSHDTLRVVLLALAGRHPLLSRGPVVVDDASDVFTVDLRRLTFASPLDVAGVAALAEQHSARRGVRLVLPEDPAVSGYLCRMNVVALLPASVEVVGEKPAEIRMNRDKVLVELTRLDQAGLAEQLWARFGDLARVQFGDPAIAVFKATGELLGNAVTHGSRPGVAFAAAQYYSGATSGRQGLEVAICDTGVGVLQHLRRNPKFARTTSDMTALRTAFRERTSGLADAGRGYGLADVLRFIGSMDLASLVLASGEAALFQRRRNAAMLRQEMTLTTPIEGTWAWLRVRLPRGKEGMLQ